MRRKIITVDDVRRKLGLSERVTNSGIIVGRGEDMIEFYMKGRDGEVRLIDSVTFHRIQKMYKSDAIDLGLLDWHNRETGEYERKTGVMVLTYG